MQLVFPTCSTIKNVFREEVTVCKKKALRKQLLDKVNYILEILRDDLMHQN